VAAIGQAGRRGSDVRSDCWISVELNGSGGIIVDLTSKVEAMYGNAIRSSVTEGMKTLDVEHASVTVEDAGALPFVIQARLEAAVRRAKGTLEAELLPPMAEHATYPTSRERFRRSRLYLPGNEPKFMLNAGLHGPDGVILDLEDSVAPSEKDAARCLIRNALRTLDFCGAERMVRINQGERGLDDLGFLVQHNLHMVLIPKVEDPEEVKAVDARIAELKERHSVTQDIFLMPIVIKAYEIATASVNVAALTIGLEDYTADIGTQRTLKGRESFWARSQVVNAARAARVQPIDTVFSDVADMEGLLESVKEAKALGFDGKGCIHPRQIAVMHRGFAPEEKEVEKAKRIVVAFEEAEAKGLGVVSLGSKMIDPPVVKRALHTVELAVRSGLLDPDWREGGGADA